MSHYTVGIIYERSDEEFRDPFLAWKRDDKAFFGSGACHILAYLFCTLHDHENFRIIHIKPKKGFTGHHMYASDGVWAFDFNGWTKEKELLKVYEQAYAKKFPGWNYDRIEINEHFLDYIKKNNHMPPEYFPYLPWERAYKFIQKFQAKPPENK